MKSFLIKISGTVQGVGFRPFVYRLARECGVRGRVRNFAGGVELTAQGAQGIVDEFISRVLAEAPPLAKIREVKADPLPDAPHYDDFAIETSSAIGSMDVDAARDTAVCDNCLREMRDPTNRRYKHPFINCTDCGPRYTIIESLPYDRKSTSMKTFAMCADCEREYKNPADRRFHAQPVCCPKCGPKLRLIDASGAEVPFSPITGAANALKTGLIVAVKGLGGFHLACDATSGDAVRRLRERKNREEKPLAIMARDLKAVEEIAKLGDASRELLESPERPIVLLEKRAGSRIADDVAPRSASFGVMLPYTPVHHLLLDEVPLLVMTSGNISDEPIARTNEDALAKLGKIADFFLLHDRAIVTRNDDSIVREAGGDAVILRRSRGFAPEPVEVPHNVDGIIACGGLMKNTAAVGRGNLCYLSQHIGDIVNIDAYRSLDTAVKNLVKMLGVKPRIAACDLHPRYPSATYADSLGVPVVRVQHHHAHIASCMAEHGLRGPVIGFAWDGTGYGEDGHSWGSEILIADYKAFRRLGHMSYLKQPGGDVAAKFPMRMAVAALLPLMGRDALRLLGTEPTEAEAVARMVERQVNSPLTSGMGRLFDATSALLGICQKNTYEGQAAAELEAATGPNEAREYPFEMSEQGGVIQFDGAKLLAEMLKDKEGGESAANIAGKFHNTLVAIIAAYALAARERFGLSEVCLSGGCFQNKILLERAIARLMRENFSVYHQSLVPPNDGGIALGQMAIASAKGNA